jgi:hypothetical protein
MVELGGEREARLFEDTTAGGPVERREGDDAVDVRASRTQSISARTAPVA